MSTSEAKAYCLEHKPYAVYNTGMGYAVQYHGIEHDTDDRIYVSEVIGSNVRYRKLMVRYTRQGRSYVIIETTRIYLDQFEKIGGNTNV